MPKHHPEPCESPVVQDLIELDEAVNDLHGALHLHGNKIAPVLKGGIVVCDEGDAAEAHLPRIESLIRRLKERVQEATAKVKDQTERAQC